MADSARDLALSEYFLARSSQLRRTAFVILHDWHGAEDVTQRAFLKLYGAWPRVSDAGRDAYMRRIVVNEALSELRRRRRRRELTTQPPPEQTPGDAPGDSAFDLVQALELLTPQQRAVVALRFLDDLSVRDTAQVLGVAEGTVRAHTSRALATLRRHLPDLISLAPPEEYR